MISNALKYMRTFASDFISYYKLLPNYWRGLKIDLIIFINDQKIKLRDILKTNIELGKHHLFKGRISDALLRFRIAHMLFDAHSKEINYWLGWCYFFKGNYDTAIAYLEDAKDHDTYKLLQFIKNSKKADLVPEKIWNIIQKIKLETTDGKYYTSYVKNKYIDVPLEFVQICLDNIKNLKPNSKILDYGCSIGLIGTIIDHFVPSKYKMIGIENITKFADHASQMEGDRGNIYDQIILESPYNADKTLKSGTYDLIISFDNLGFTKDLKSHFKSFHKSLTKGGYLAILVNSGKHTSWSTNKQSFEFDENDIQNQLILEDFNIIDIKKWSLSKNKSFIGFICNK